MSPATEGFQSLPRRAAAGRGDVEDDWGDSGNRRMF
jgi:hypothetical protein